MTPTPMIIAVAALVAASVQGQPTPDTQFKPPIESPAYPKGSGPVVLIDEAHFNWHTATERVDSVATFTGSAFRVDKGGEPLLVFGPGIVSFTPTNFWMYQADTPRIPVTGWFQGAVMRVGKGRLAVFGEAAMFSAQVDGPNREPFGMNTPVAKQNPQFVLNLLHWLSGLLDK